MNKKTLAIVLVLVLFIYLSRSYESNTRTIVDSNHSIKKRPIKTKSSSKKKSRTRPSKSAPRIIKNAKAKKHLIEESIKKVKNYNKSYEACGIVSTEMEVYFDYDVKDIPPIEKVISDIEKLKKINVEDHEVDLYNYFYQIQNNREALLESYKHMERTDHHCSAFAVFSLFNLIDEGRTEQGLPLVSKQYLMELRPVILEYAQLKMRGKLSLLNVLIVTSIVERIYEHTGMNLPIVEKLRFEREKYEEISQSLREERNWGTFKENEDAEFLSAKSFVENAYKENEFASEVQSIMKGILGWN